MKHKFLTSAVFTTCFLFAGTSVAAAGSNHDEAVGAANASQVQVEENVVEYESFFERTDDGSEYIHLELSGGNAELQENGTVEVVSDNGELVEELDTTIADAETETDIEVSYEVSDDGERVTVSLPEIEASDVSEGDLPVVANDACGLTNLLIGLGSGAATGAPGGPGGAAVGALTGAITSGISAAATC